MYLETYHNVKLNPNIMMNDFLLTPPHYHIDSTLRNRKPYCKTKLLWYNYSNNGKGDYVFCIRAFWIIFGIRCAQH